jgi:hypothetical protein
MKLVKLIKRRCMSFVVGHHKVGQSYIIVQTELARTSLLNEAAIAMIATSWPPPEVVHKLKLIKLFDACFILYIYNYQHPHIAATLIALPNFYEQTG